MTTTKQFLEAVLPSQGFRFIQLLFPPGPDGQRKSPQKDFSPGEIEDMLSFARWGVSKGADAYFAVGGYSAIAGELKRVAAAARLHRCLRLDLDVGTSEPGKTPKYATKRDAAHGLFAFLQVLQLPTPWVVDSGYGLHVYWAFDADIDAPMWQSLATRLRTACDQHGLLADHTTTIDAARILRLPGTVNFKHGAQVPVGILRAGATSSVAVFDAALPPLSIDTPPIFAMGALPAVMQGQPISPLQASLHPPYTIKGMMTGCPGLRDMLATRGANASGKLWLLSMGLLHKAEDPPQAKYNVARAISDGHPTFTQQDFDQKWQQVQRQNYHPATCDKMASEGMAACRTCPLRGSIKTPSALGRPEIPVQPPCPETAIPAPTVLVPPPAPVHAREQLTQLGIFMLSNLSTKVRVVDGQLSKGVKIHGGVPHVRAEIAQPDGSVTVVWRPIGGYRILEVERLLDTVGKQSLTAITFDRHADKHVRVEATNKDLSEPRNFSALLHANGIYLNKKDTTQLLDTFMPEFLTQLQRARSANQIAGRCGWTDDFSGFVLGTRLYSGGIVEHVRPSVAPDEMEAYHEHGDEQVWRNAFDIALGGGVDRQAVLALAIAAPLMVFTGLDGLMLNAYSPESGIGKSTLCDAALSIWGAPNKLRKDFRDTANATFKLASIVGNLPMVVDEFTNVEGKALSDYVYTITQGREKHRLTADSKLNMSGQRWCLPTIVTSNNSIHEKLQSYRRDAVAEAARVFELRLRPLNTPPGQLAVAKQALMHLRSHYGFLGPKLVAIYLSRTPDEWRKTVNARIAHWDATVSQDASDRFRSACAALIDIGAAIGTQMGYAFDRVQVMQVIQDQWRDQHNEFEIARKLPFDFINGYIIEHLNDFAMLGGPNGDSLMNASARRYHGEIRGKAVNAKFTPQSVMIPLDLLRDYIKEKNGNWKAISEWLKKELHPAGHVMRLGNINFLEGQFQQVRTQAVEFAPSILGQSIGHIAAVPTHLPPPAIAPKQRTSP